MSSRLSISSSVAILSNVYRLGCETLGHHLLTVAGFLPRSSASHFAVRFFSTGTTYMRFKSFICKYLSFERKYIQNNRQQKSFHLEMTFVNVSFQIIMSFLLTNFTNSTFVQGERRSQVYLDYAEPQPNVC